jgi:hypothetical protein
MMILILGSLVYNLIEFDYSLGMFAELNLPYVIGIGAGVCGLILALIMLKYNQLKPSLDNQSKKA